MQNPRPSTIVIRVFGSLVVLLAIFVFGAMIYHTPKGATESNVELEPEQKFLN